MLNTETPKYTHDCTDCKFLGNYKGTHYHYDLYYCPQSGMPTVVARYGNEGAEYSSGLGFTLPHLVEAERLAKEQGYLK
jgi:hypothetical protein